MADYWFTLPILTLIGGLLALAPLGVQVLDRGVVFIDLAVAQAAAAGTLWLNVFYHTHDPWLLIPASMTSALVCSACVAWLTKRWPERREALIGLLYVMGAMIALLGAQFNPHGKDDLQQLLAADILWSDETDALLAVVCAIAVLAINIFRRDLLNRDLVFYGLFAVVASLMVQSLGVFLVFALLIAPALLIHHTSRGIAVSTMAASIALGSGCSWFFDLPSGMCLTLLISLAGIASIYNDKNCSFNQSALNSSDHRRCRS